MSWLSDTQQGFVNSELGGRQCTAQMVAEIILAHFAGRLSGEIYRAAATFGAGSEGKDRTKAV